MTPSTILLLLVPPILWAGNAVTGRLVHALVPPMTFNFLRWAIALLLLLPLAGHVLRPGSEIWPLWRRFAVMGLLGIGCYNALQYLALQTSEPINTTLVGSSMPVWMMVVGTLFFGAKVQRSQVLGALLSICGVLVVLCRGEWQQLLALRLRPGDVFMLLATVLWAFYSWMLVRPRESAALRADWSAFLLAQVAFGSAWAGLFTAAEWTFTTPRIHWGWPLAAALLFVAVGPSIVAYRCFGAAIGRVGPSVASFFVNLTPLFAALLSAAFLGEPPHLYHALAFALLVGGIVLASSRRTAVAVPET